MSAVIYLEKDDASYLLTDAAEYYADGVIARFGDKCLAIPEAHCAVTVIGPAIWHNLICEGIQGNFTSFDEVIAGLPAMARRLFDEYSAAVKWPMVTGEVWVVGFSQALGRVLAFTLSMCGDDEWERWKMLSPGIEKTRTPFVPDVQQYGFNANPGITDVEQLRAAKFPICDTNLRDPEVDLLHYMEIQRRERFQSVGGKHCVGGWATLTKVDASGVTQKRLHTWSEDKVGALITPRPINWAQWRAARSAPPGTSKLKRDVLARKAAKGLRLAG